MTGGGGTAPHLRGSGVEPRLRLPFRAMLGVTSAVGVAAGIVAAVVALRVGGGDAALSAAASASVALFVNLAGILAIGPWYERAAGTWATLWLAGIVGRLLLTPVIGAAVYSATPSGPEVFVLSLAGTYLACLAAEAAVVARGVARSLRRAESPSAPVPPPDSAPK